MDFNFYPFCTDFRTPMDIHTLKKSLFNDIPQPLSFLTDHGMGESGPPVTARAFGSSVFFYTETQKWTVLTPICPVVSSSVNSFTSPTHTLTVQPPSEWTDRMTTQLRAAAVIAYEQQLLPLACAAFGTFEEFWSQCRKPKMLTIEAPAFSRRGRHKQFINLFHNGTEITGRVLLQRHSSVRIGVQWSLSESEESGEFGWRPHFSGGMNVHRFGGEPPALRRPWSWGTINPTTLTVPLHDSFVVKTPGLSVESVVGNVVTVDRHRKPTFVAAIQALHVLAGKAPWDGTICVVGPKKVRTGHIIVASILPQIEGGHISWYTHKLIVSKPMEPAAKRQCQGLGSAPEFGI